MTQKIDVIRFELEIPAGISIVYEHEELPLDSPERSHVRSLARFGSAQVS